MCPARVFCSPPTVSQGLSHCRLSAPAVAGTCWKGWSGMSFVRLCSWAVPRCILSVCYCWRRRISWAGALLQSQPGDGLITRRHLSAPSHTAMTSWTSGWCKYGRSDFPFCGLGISMWLCGCAYVERYFLQSPAGSGRTGSQNVHHFHSSVLVHVFPWCPRSQCYLTRSWRWSLPSVWSCLWLLLCLSLPAVAGRIPLFFPLLHHCWEHSTDSVQSPRFVASCASAWCPSSWWQTWLWWCGSWPVPSRQVLAVPLVPASGPCPQCGGLHPPCVPNTTAALLMTISAILSVATLSRIVRELQSCSSSALSLLGWFSPLHTLS